MAGFGSIQEESRGPRGPWRDEGGFALIFGLVFTVLLTMVALRFQGLGGLEADLVQRQVTHSQALHLAEAGVERSIYELRLDPTWRGVDPLNGVAFADGDRSTPGGTGDYQVFLYDSTNNNQGLYDATIPAGQIRLEGTGTAGPSGTSSLRRVAAQVSLVTDFNVPSPIHIPGRVDSARLEDPGFRIDGYDTDPQTGVREATPCDTRYGVTSVGSVTTIRSELSDSGTSNQVVGLGSNPSVFQLPSSEGADVNQLVSRILAASAGQSFYTSLGETRIQSNTTWGSYPSDLRVVRVTGRLEVDSNTLSGAGILIVDNEFRIDNGANFNWKGLVIIHNRDGADGGEPELEDRGNGTVYGAVLLGGGDGESDLEIRNGSARFIYSCDALNAVASFLPAASTVQRVDTVSWREMSP
ncbi:MAG: hypothetical protein HYY20_03535 [Candidatus Tectomicrobia bacterium]|uniref:Type 4 fimbrial biogenesis protein PilX N-terminal domain-containing protein n=1 Tax=Tectimicrobiota bacterium TaxID=2528274 RepID=A0A932CMZ2_UNCTE|nr:hypothetical protein [Candidatus Tectomicrobia bacterium]